MKLGKRWIVGLLAGGIVAVVAAHQPAVAQDTQLGVWEYDASNDSLTKTRSHAAFVFDGSAAKLGLLVVKCDREDLAPYVKYTHHGVFFGTDGPTLARYRVDENDLHEEDWRLFEKSVVNFNKGQVYDMVQQMIAGSSVTVEVSDFRYRKYRTVFGLKGSASALTKVLENCGDK